MPLSRTPFPPCSPADAVRQALIGSLYRVHRPELADLVASADLAVDLSVVWLRPLDRSLSSAWLEQRLLSAALEGGLPVEWIHVLSG